jgi:hypothetical protein
LLAGARGFYLSLLERVFHVKILCLRAVISFRSSLLPIAFITTIVRTSNVGQDFHMGTSHCPN